MEPRKQVTGSHGVLLLVPSAATWGQETQGCVASADLGVWFLLLMSVGAFMGSGKERVVKKSELSGIPNTS